jgi:hypothetical protein
MGTGIELCNADAPLVIEDELLRLKSDATGECNVPLVDYFNVKRLHCYDLYSSFNSGASITSPQPLLPLALPSLAHQPSAVSLPQGPA